MGKLCQQRRSRARMTRYNITKAKEAIEAKDIKIVVLENEINKLKGENKDVCFSNKKDIEKALALQKQKLNEKHKEILQKFSDDLKIKYKKNFDDMVEHFQNEISSLQKTLEIEKATRLSLNIKRPVYSPGRYTETDSVEIDTKRSPNLNTDNASDALAMNTKADNVDRFPNRVPYLDTMEQLRKEFGIKPD